jgi:oligosaccharide translocation protein RFT1
MGDASDVAVSGASLLVALQVVSRAVTFLANQAVLRFLTPEVLGISTQLEVFYLSILFFSRESLRVAVQRHRSAAAVSNSTAPDDRDIAKSVTARSNQEVINLGYIAIGLGLLSSVILGWSYLHAVSAAALAATPHLRGSLFIYAAAALLELISEPCFLLFQIRLQVRARASAESAGTLVRCIVVLATAVWTFRQRIDAGALPFALGQLCYGGTLLAVFAWYGSVLASAEGFGLLPKRLAAATVNSSTTMADESTDTYSLGYFYRPTLDLASSMFAQSFVKHILTQGDTFMVSILSTPTEQGVYALANNYGGLAARLIFQPIEETSRSYFSRLLSPQTLKKTDAANQKVSQGSTVPRAAASKAASQLATIIRCYAIIAVPLAAVGPTAAPLLLSLIAGPRWASSGAGACLSAYVWYIPLMALNGVLEAFVASVATQSQVHQQSLWMGAFSLIFVTAGAVFLRFLGWGAIGLVAANGVNMACRIVWCLFFITTYFRPLGVRFDLRALRPKPQSCLVAAAAAHLIKKIGERSGSVLTAGDTILALAKIAAVAIPLVMVL